MNTIILECKGVTKQFGGLEAVKQVNLRVNKGERRAIIGPNGAGKTTLFRLIDGELSLTSGRIRLFGRDITRMPSHRRVQFGLGRTFQIVNLFPTLTVMENLILATMGLKKTKFSMLKPLSAYRELYIKGREILEKVGISPEKENKVVKYLSYGEQRQIEVALALISNPKILLLDEPTAGLSQAERSLVIEVIQGFDRSITVLIVEHDMDVVFEIADRITVLHKGKVFAEGSPMEIRNSTEVRQIYLGSEGG